MNTTSNDRADQVTPYAAPGTGTGTCGGTSAGPGTCGPDEARWTPHPLRARALSLSVFVVPVAASYLTTRLAAPFLRDLPVLGRVLALGALAIVVGIAVERVMRRVLPLATLLRMTLLFPDHAPSRFALARSSGSTRMLEERVRTHPGEPTGAAAVRILGLVAALSAHDRLTSGHSERVRTFTDVIAAELHLSGPDRDRLRWAALLHDIGKLKVAGTVLNKPGRLDAAEWKLVRRHPDQGALLAAPLLDWLGEWGAAIGEHHERYDGLGYPLGLAGHDIALGARIVAVADVFEVMTAARSYKRPGSVSAARRELAKVAGTQLDPACVRAFLGASLPRVLWAVGPMALLANLPFLRTVVDAGQVVELAGRTTAGQAGTVAVAATVAVATTTASVAGLAAPASTSPGALTTGSTTVPSQRGEPAGIGRASLPKPRAGTIALAGATVARPVAAAVTAAVTTAVAAPADPSTPPGTAVALPAPGPDPDRAVPVPDVAEPARSAPSARPTTPAAGQAAVSGVPGVDTPAVPTPGPVTVARPPLVSLGTAANYAVLAGSAVTSTGATEVTGMVGLSPGTAVTGFLAGLVNGAVHADDAASGQAKADLATAFVDADALPVTDTIGVELGGTTRAPGVYDSPAGTFGITGTLTLDAGGDPDAVFVFRSASTLITASGSRVNLVGGARASNVFWSVGSSATLGTFSVLRGSVLARVSITATTGVTVTGRLLARGGAVTLDTTTVILPTG